MIQLVDDAILTAPVGAKARMLGVLTRMSQEWSWRVPEGAALTIDECGALLHDTAHEAAVVSSFADVGLDTCVAVRSSGCLEDLSGRSAAGQYETVLAVNGTSELSSALRAVLLSYENATARSYRQATAVASELRAGGGVIVQRMVDADRSGAMYVREAGVIIEAVHGLGAGLMAGRVTPTHYRVDAASGEVACVPSPQRTMEVLHGRRLVQTARHPSGHDDVLLEPDEVLDLFDLGYGLREHFGSDQEVEFAFGKDGRLAVLQARPLGASAPAA